MIDSHADLEPDYSTMKELILEVEYCAWLRSDGIITFECGLGLEQNVLDWDMYDFGLGINLVHKRHHDEGHKDKYWCVTATTEWDEEAFKVGYTFDCTCKERA